MELNMVYLANNKMILTAIEVINIFFYHHMITSIEFHETDPIFLHKTYQVAP